MKRVVLEESQHMSVVESAAKLFDFLAARDTTFTRHLQPGLSRAEIHALVKPTGVVLPEEALQFYEYYSLPRGYQYIPKYPNGMGQPTFYGIYWMLGLEDAAEDYKKWVTMEEYEEYEGSRGWLPFLQEDAYYYLLDTAFSSQNLCPVLSLPEAFEPEPAFVSMAAMFETMYDWVNENALAVEEGHLAGAYAGDPVKVGQIAVRHNPGIARWECMAAGTK